MRKQRKINVASVILSGSCKAFNHCQDFNSWWVMVLPFFSSALCFLCYSFILFSVFLSSFFFFWYFSNFLPFPFPFPFLLSISLSFFHAHASWLTPAHQKVFSSSPKSVKEWNCHRFCPILKLPEFWHQATTNGTKKVKIPGVRFDFDNSYRSKRQQTKENLGFLEMESASEIGAVRIRHSIWEFATQTVIVWILLDTAGWQAKMASIELWIQWCNAHGPHCETSLT